MELVGGIRTTDDFEKRLIQHNTSVHNEAFTSRGIPWTRFLVIEGLSSAQAFAAEKHIKKMKSKIYIRNLEKHPDMVENLMKRFAV